MAVSELEIQYHGVTGLRLQGGNRGRLGLRMACYLHML